MLKNLTTILKKHKTKLIAVIPIVGIIAAMYLFQCLHLPLAVTNIFFVSTSFVYMNYWWKKNAESKWELILIWAAFSFRMIICLLDIYTEAIAKLPFTGGDSAAYLEVAEGYYYGRPGWCTYYPYVINAIFQIAGLNRFAAQFVNILCWCVCTLIIQKSCALLDIKKEFRLLAVFLYSLMPVNLIYTSILMREAIPAMAMLYLFYHILKWMKDGNYVSLIVGVLVSAPGFLMHNSMLAIWAVLIFTVILYSPSRQRFCVEKKSIAAILLGILGIAGLIFAMSKGFITVQIPDFSNGIFEAINERLKSFYNNYGGSTYLMNEYVYDYPSLITGTMKRMFYFYCSPVPFLWRGFSDMIAFFGSTAVYIMSVVAAAVSLFFKKKDSYRFIMAFTIFLLCGIFAWMVSNGGTAMRHREKFLGIVVLLGVYSIQLIKENRKTKSNR